MSIIQLGVSGDYPPTPASDPNASNLVLALPLNSSYNLRDLSAKIRGSGSSYNLQTNAGSFDNQSFQYYGSSHLAGAPNNSTVRIKTLSALPAFGTQDFCIECWLLIPSIPSPQLSIAYCHNNTDAGLQLLLLGSSQSNSGGLFFSGGGGGHVSHTNPNVVPLNQWFHCAVTRSGSTLQIFVNGVNQVVYGGSVTGNFNGSFDLIALASSDSACNTVRLQDYRIYQGVAKYTSNFTPPGAMFI